MKKPTKRLVAALLAVASLLVLVTVSSKVRKKDS